jgi:hypothetical protein
MKSGLVQVSILAAVLIPALARPSTAAGVRAVRVEKGPAIDGLLSDPVWAAALPFSEFRTAEPRPNDEPSERTELRVLYDSENLYIGVRCADREPARIAARTLAHDAAAGQGHDPWHGPQGLPSDDLVRVLLDPFQDKRNAYVFFVNPRGARGEGLASGGQASLNWDGVWDAASRILADGWSTELRIPFKTLSFKPGLTVWGINVERTIARKLETIRLSGFNRDSVFYNPMEAAPLEGIEGVHQGLGITFRPYGLASLLSESGWAATGASTERKVDGGFDLYKNFTPNFVGVVSYNMDFAETEADERRINLTRFPLFFPEKRMFFLEGSEVFNFSSSISFTPFISRSIGLVGGRQIPVVFGSKLYGKIGRTNLAALDVQTGASEGLPGRNFLAARMTQDVFAESKVGWIFTNGSPSGGRNSLFGLDFNYSTSKLAGNKNLWLAAWLAYNWNEHKDGRHYGFGLRANYPNDLWDIETTYAYYGEALDPAMGYMMRPAMQTFFVRVGYQPRPETGWLGPLVRQFYFNASGDFYWDLAGRLETSRLSASPLSLRTESGERIGVELNVNRDVLPYDYEVARGVILPSGPYDFVNGQVQLETANHRPLALSLGATMGEFYSGHYDDLSAGLTFKYRGYLSLSADANLVRGRLPQGRFNENVYQVKADIFLSPDLGLMNYIQYDDISRELGWSVRLRWQISPGNLIYLVYNKNWERRWDPTSRFVPLEGRGVFKISLSIRP